MRNLIVIAAALFAMVACGETIEANRSPIIYWIDSISYAQDEHTDSGSVQQGEATLIHEQGADKDGTETRTNTNKTRAGGGVKTTGDASASTSGRPSAKVGVHAEAYVETEFSWEQERVARVSSKQRTWARAQQTARDDIKTSRSDWKLRFNINFRNVSFDKIFKYHEGKDSGLFLVVLDDKEKPYRIPLLPEFIAPDSFELRSESTLHVKADIPDKNIKEILRTAEICGMLDKCVLVEFRDQFQLVEDGSGQLWDYHDVNVCKVMASGFDVSVNAKLPIVIDSNGKTYSNVLEEVSSKLPAECRFGFSTNGALDSVFGKSFGCFDKDSKGVYAILLEMHGKVKNSLSREELSKKPSLGYDNRNLNFVRVSLMDVYDNPALYPESVISNGIDFVENSVKINDEDLFACAVLAKKCRIYSAFGHCLSRMENVNAFLLNEDDITHALSLIIMADKAEYFKKLYECVGLGSRGWARADRTMLGFAAGCGSLNIVKWLIEECPQKYQREVDELVPDGKKDSPGAAGKTPLYWAAESGHLSVCQYLVSRGADVNRKFYDYMEKSKKIERRDELVSEKEIKDDSVREYIKSERKVDYVRRKWFYWRDDATERDIREWVNHGVSPDARLGGEWSLLSRAIELNSTSLVEFLVDKNVDLNGQHSVCPTDKRTALMLACEMGDASLVSKLIQKGADLYAHQENGMSAFHYAIRHKKYACAKMILGNMDVTKCPQVEDDGVKLNLFEYVGKYCDNKEFCEQVKAKDTDAWALMIAFWHGKEFRDCLDRCVLSEIDAKFLLELSHTVKMADDLYERGLLRNYLSEIEGDEGRRNVLEQMDPAWIECLEFLELRKKVDQGDAVAQNKLGARYLKGIGVYKDVDKGFKLVKQSAAQGHSEALYNLSVCYKKGLGVEKDIEQSKYYLQRAIDSGYEP